MSRGYEDRVGEIIYSTLRCMVLFHAHDPYFSVCFVAPRERFGVGYYYACTLLAPVRLAYEKISILISVAPHERFGVGYYYACTLLAPVRLAYEKISILISVAPHERFGVGITTPAPYSLRYDTQASLANCSFAEQNMHLVSAKNRVYLSRCSSEATCLLPQCLALHTKPSISHLPMAKYIAATLALQYRVVRKHNISLQHLKCCTHGG